MAREGLPEPSLRDSVAPGPEDAGRAAVFQAEGRAWVDAQRWEQAGGGKAR